MECGDAESETEKQNDDSPEKSKLLNDGVRENGDSKYDEGSNLRIPVTVLDDSGIGSSLSQLKEDAGLRAKSQNEHGERKPKANVSFQLEEACNHKNVQNNTQRRETGDSYKDPKIKYLKHSGPENLFDTPPNSLVCNIPESVLQTTTECTDSVNSAVVGEEETEDTNPTEYDSVNNLEENTSSDSTLVTSSENGSDTLQNDSLIKPCAKSDNDKYNPTIPMQHWSPVKEPNNKETSKNAECYNEGKGLPPEQWTPTKSQKHQAIENDSLVISRTNALEWGTSARTISNTSEATIARKSSDRKKYTFEEIIQIIEEKIQGLLMKVDFCVPQTRADLKFIQRQTRYSSDVILNRRVVDRIVKMGIAHVFLKVWQSVSNVDYLHPDKLIVFKNLQAVLSIIWNCTDKSSALCESLVKCGVVQLLITELATVRIRTGDYANENTLYLVKAYLGILHNVARLCAVSRKLFRSSNAVEILKMYLCSEQGLVKTKAYLILSYIINEEENDVINATHDHLNYIIGILREALSSENHYAKTTAFWANEIADGLNHLAVNDANKVRMGQLGVIQLYLKLLQSDSMEEQSLGTAGIWILAFCDENKHLINKIHGCIEALYALANNSPYESIRRSAHGAIWVIKRTPERPTIEQVKEADIPHVMISYNWSAQQTMMKVRNRLKAAGYKVWMDVDNMSGSTLQAMALAVERAAVVLICMSQVYKDSASCRTEAEYTYSQRKDIIPILLQQGYVPDGWLGALVGTRIYFDLTDEGTFHCQIDKLIREIGNRGRMTTPKTTLAASAEYDDQRTRGSSVCSDLSLSSSTSSLHSYRRIPNQSTAVWNHSDVRQWLASHQLGHVAERFEGFTGEVLLQYKSMMKTAPEYFYSSLDTKLRLDLVTSLKFAKALNAIDASV